MALLADNIQESNNICTAPKPLAPDRFLLTRRSMRLFKAPGIETIWPD
jgi:hypothetical protein